MKILWLADSASAPDPNDLLAPHYAWQATASLGEALFELEQDREAFHACLICLPLSEDEPRAALEEMHRVKSSLPIVFIHESGAAAEAVELLKAGAQHYFDRHPSRDALRAFLSTLRSKTSEPQPQAAWEQNLVGSSPAMQKVKQMIALIAGRRSTVLILGETGTGKEVVARAIHQASPRAEKPWIPVNCAAIPENLLESELFGYEKGAFTGAMTAKPGKFELADKGSIFLDEIGDVPPTIQVKLLRVLQEREFERLGGTKTLKVDVRLIAATNRDLRVALEQGTFREDLYYRLNVVPINIPPLREHKEDIPDLVRMFLDRFAEEAGKQVSGLSPAAMKRLMDFHWPGNVRELENIIERAVALSTSNVIDVEDIQLDVSPARLRTADAESSAPFPPPGVTLEAFEDEIIQEALRRAGGNKSQAARLLGLSRNALRYRLSKMGVPDEDNSDE